MKGLLVGLLLSALQVQGVAGKKGVMLVFDAFEPAGIQEVGLLFLPAQGTSSGDPLARKVCAVSGKASSVCSRAHTVRVKRFPLPPARLQDTVIWVMRDGWKRGAGEVGLWIRGVDGTVEVGWLKEGVGLQVVGDTFRWPFAGYDPGQSYTYPWGVYPDVNVQWFKFWTWGDMFVTEVKSAVSDGRLYMANGGEVLEVMDVETGEVVDSVEMVSNVNAAVLIGDSLLVVASTFGTLEPEKDTTLKLFRLPDLERVWGMTGLKAVQSVMVVGDTIVTGGAGGVRAITVDGRMIQRWPLFGWIQVPVLVSDTVLVGWGEGGNLVFYRWPTEDTLWVVNLNIGGGWLRVLPSYPDILWVMEYNEPLFGLAPATRQVVEIPTSPEVAVATVGWRDTLLVMEAFWEWNSHILGSTLKVWVPKESEWRLADKAYMYLGKEGGWLPGLSGYVDLVGAIWILAQYGYVVDPRAVVVDNLGEMPGDWEEWQYAVPSSFFYPLFYKDLVIHANRMGRFVLRGQSQPPPGWGEVERPVRLVVLPRRVRVESMPEAWEGASFWLQDVLGRRVVSGRVRGRVLEVGPLKPGVYRLRIGNTWVRKVVVF